MLVEWRLINPSRMVENTNPDVFVSRTNLYENILAYFPDCMREPRSNLVDLVPVS